MPATVNFLPVGGVIATSSAGTVVVEPPPEDPPEDDVTDPLVIWRVGAVYTSIDPTNPSSLFGGTWVGIASGRCLVGFDGSDPDFNAPEKTTGAKTITLAETHLPSHTHLQNAHVHAQDPHTHLQNSHTHVQDAHSHTIPVGATDDTAAPFDRADAGTNASGANATTATGTAVAVNQVATAVNQGATATNQSATAVNLATGGGQAHGNVQPSFVVYFFKRTA